MENRKSLLKLSSVDILPNLSIRIPTVEEILEDEFSYYNIILSLTASPFQYMVQLDNIGIDFTTISDYQLFMMLFTVYAKSDLSIIFGDLDTSDFIVQGEGNCEFLFSHKNKLEINEDVYHNIVNTIRKINLLEKVKVSNPHFKWGFTFYPSGDYYWFRQRRDFAVPLFLVALLCRARYFLPSSSLSFSSCS